MQKISSAPVTSSIALVADALPLDSVPVDIVTDLTLPDVGSVVSDASDFVADSAVVLGRQGGRLVGRTTRVVWRHRSTVAMVVVAALAVVGLVTILKRRSDDDVTDTSD